MKKLFGGLNITWIKLIIFAVIAGLYTGAMAALPVTKDTSFADISITFEWWVLFGIIIIMNSKTGSTRLILTAPDGTQRVFDLVIERSSYRITDSK